MQLQTKHVPLSARFDKALKLESRKIKFKIKTETKIKNRIKNQKFANLKSLVVLDLVKAKMKKNHKKI